MPQSIPILLTRNVLVEKFSVTQLRKKAIALYESRFDTWEQLDQLGLYYLDLEPYLKKSECKAFKNRFEDIEYYLCDKEN